MKLPNLTPGRVLMIVLAAWAMVMVVPDLYRVFAPLASFGLIADNDGVIVNTTGPFATPAESPAAAAGLARGDRIDLEAMRCIPIDSARCRSLLTVLGGLGGRQVVLLPGREIELAIRGAGVEPSRIVRLKAALPAHGWGESIVLLADTIVAIVVILAACRLVWLRPGKMTWGFFLYAIWFNPGQTFAYYALLQRWPMAVFAQEFAEAFAHGAGFAGLLVFAMRFPTDAPTRLWTRFRWLPLALGIVIAALGLATFTNAFGFPTETLTLALFLFGYAIDAGILVVLLQRRRRLPTQDRQRMLWVIWGCAIGLSTFIFAEIAQSTSLLPHRLGFSPPAALVGLLYLLNGVLAYFVSVAVLHRRVVSVAIPLRYGTILTVLTLAVGIPIVNLHELLSHYQERLRIPEWIWLFVVAPVALVLLQRLHEIVVKLVDRVLLRRFHASRERLQAAGTAMLKAPSLEEIDRLAVNTPVAALQLASGAVFRKHAEAFRREYAVGWDASPLRELRPDQDAVVLRSVDTQAPVRLPRDAWRRPELETELHAPCLALALRTDALGPIAILLLGPHENGNDIDPDEREMLSDFALRSAAGYERVAFARLRDEVSALKAKLAALKTATS
jgi:hypothetical protein